jgi:hypothetical protein
VEITCFEELIKKLTMSVDLTKLYFEFWGIFKNHEMILDIAGKDPSGLLEKKTKRNCLEVIRIIGSAMQMKKLLVSKDREIYFIINAMDHVGVQPDFMIIKGILQIYQKLLIQRLM